MLADTGFLEYVIKIKKFILKCKIQMARCQILMKPIRSIVAAAVTFMCG
jgi:hypothetical protein